MRALQTRRQFLHSAAALGLVAPGSALGFSPLQDKGKVPAKRSLVVIFLRGGADFLNMIIPRNDASYGLSRPSIGIAGDALPALDSQWGLHPALQPLLPLYKAKEFAPIINAGSPHETRSHFDAQDFMAFAAPGDRTVHNGWLNRYLNATSTGTANDFRALGMQRLLPTSLRGEFPVLAVPDNVDNKRSSKVLGQFEKLYGADGQKRADDEDEGGAEESGGMGEMDDARDEGLDVTQSGKVTIETLRRLREILSKSKRGEHGYPKTSLGQGLERIAHVILSDAALEVAGIDVGQWDHHANQGGADGVHSRMLRDLAQALTAFRAHLGPAFANTLVLVMTEFGRTVLENGSGGTDHGHGSGMFLLGGGLKGGEVHGDWSGLKSDRLYEGRDLPVNTDFRDIYYTVLREHMDFKVPKEFFPDYKPKKLDLFA